MGSRGVVDRRPSNQRERTQNLKHAIFYLVVAALLFLGNQLAKHPRADGNQSDAVSNVSLDLLVRSEPMPARNAPIERAVYVIHFRLMNRGNQSVFYPVYAGTNCPTGHIVYRAAPGSEWTVLSPPEMPGSTSARPRAEGDAAWVEMPPGGSMECTTILGRRSGIMHMSLT